MANIPKIRFKGFTEDWEQRKLGEVAQITMGQSPDGSTYSDTPSDYILVQGNADLKDGWVSPRIWTTQKTKTAAAGDLIMSVRAPAGAMGKTAYDVVLGRGVAGIKGNEFIYQTLVKMDSNGYWKRLAAGSTFESVNSDAVNNAEIMIPQDMAEQDRIGGYFKQLDSLITLHQRKCDETKELKKYMLQKMFPKNGERVPEIRFEGFTGDWEQRKLGDVFEQTSNFVNPNEHDIELWSLTVEDGLTPKSERYNREFLVKKEDNFKEVRPGDIVYNPMNMTLGAVGYNAMGKSVAVSGYYITMIAKENNDAYYINTWLKSPQALLLYKTYATGSLIEKQRVQFPTLSIIPVSFPSFAEQQKIGKCFEELDNLITLHQRKCDELKEVKMYMLQNMFPAE
ncbi:MAG: restriction endonuclease subunit S [Lachnospiraceae bacterium]|nr:restriction endonuclease subunit S [Lachnospiraceae bacterium]